MRFSPYFTFDYYLTIPVSGVFFSNPSDGDVAMAKFFVVGDREAQGVATFPLCPWHVLVVSVEVVPHPRVLHTAPDTLGRVVPITAVIMVVYLAT